MALTAFCSTCRRKVYIEEGHTAVCPVCSTPLVETIEPSETEEQDQASGTK